MLNSDVKIIKENFEQEKYFDEKNKRFYNPTGKNAKTFFDVLKWKLSTTPEEWPNYVKNEFSFKLEKNDIDEQAIVTYVNHSTFLIQLNGYNILTDPVFSERVSPISWAGPKRVRNVGIKISELPKIDVIIISHNHYDHLDIKSLIKINELFSPLFLIPYGDKDIFESEDIKNTIEMKWWETAVISNDLRITYTPSQHFSNRGLFDRDKSLWGSYLINFKGRKIFFGGDTGYSSHFKDIGSYFKSVDLAFIPIGAYAPRWFMKEVHTNPDDAVKAHLDLNSNLSIGMHYGTFQLTDEGIDDPIKDLEKAKLKYKIKSEDFITLKIGKSYKFNLKNK